MARIIRRRARWLFDRHRTARELALLLRWRRLRSNVPDLAHIPFYEELPNGPVQREEALLLFGLVRVLRPAVLLEIGFLHGASSFNLLRAMDPDARLYSFDIEPSCAEAALARFGDDPRLHFKLRAQTEIDRADLDGLSADFVFLDASHDLERNQATFERLVEIMDERALLAVHDTGTVRREFIPPGHEAYDATDQWIGDAEFEPQPDERAFVNWILEEHPEFAQIHLHSSRTPRWGLTLLQLVGPLPRPDRSPELGSSQPDAARR